MAEKKHSIKIDDETYKKLDEYRGKRETFSQAINRLLLLLSKVGELRSILEGGETFEQWQEEQLAKRLRRAAAGDSQKVPDLPTG